MGVDGGKGERTQGRLEGEPPKGSDGIKCWYTGTRVTEARRSAGSSSPQDGGGGREGEPELPLQP